MHFTRSQPGRPLHVLWVTTKSPWPAHDGGRLLMDGTLRALDPEQIRVTLLFPEEPQPPSSRDAPAQDELPACIERIRATPVKRTKRIPVAIGRPITASRHRFLDLRRSVEAALADQQIDVIHAEQPHALENLPSDTPPVLLRTQNVEQDLWRLMADTRTGPLRWPMRVESRRVARWERAALRRVQQVVAISAEDRDRLIQVAGPGHPPVCWVAPAMATSQPAGARLGGDPALVLFGGSSWGPNHDGAQHFLEHSWPAIRAGLPSCQLHIFGGDPSVDRLPGVRHHAAPFATRSAFAEGALVVVPVRSASGVRMKILDAWSRGLAAITTETGAIGLGSRGREILRPVRRLEDLHQAVHRLLDRDLAKQQVQDGRQWMREHTDPCRVGSSFLDLYRTLSSRE